MKKIIISIHDITPFFMQELKIIFRELDKLKIKKYEMLVVPDWDNKNPIEQNKEFISLVKKNLSKDSRIVLHGYTHKSDNWLRKNMTAVIAVAECANLDEKEIELRIKKGLKKIKQVFNITPTGFVPPCWRFPKNAVSVLKKYFKYYTTYTQIDYFNHQITSVALCYSGGDNVLFQKAMKKISSLIAHITNNKIVRISIHPEDVKTGNIKQAVKDLKFLLKKGWKPALYEDFIKK